ncbi:hypothetical protein BDA99DRAFT_500978 [Phascolomyces articulosus]|uniref:Wax synthase domain-containing protein n=1 Tax=Phascolomyces articulosus TaxID=60185 RepID=A0AAD5KIC9_9FUNG|nr:hypothetical protein BDA99DRAFT_500978 [Phascolomyces articulosus]
MEFATIVHALKSGDDRLFLPTPVFLGIAIIPGMLQWKLLMLPCDKVSSRTKQIISLPFLIIELLIPIIFAGGHRALTIIAGLYLFNTVLRCSEALYITPFLEGSEAYIDANKLHQDFWACLRLPSSSPSSNKKDTNDKKLRPWYHLILPLTMSALITDFLASWYSTFSGQDVFDMQEKRPGLYFVFFFFAVMILTSAINTFGYIFRLLYTILYDGGYYDPDEWRLLMEYPVFASSFNNMWNYRWHQTFRGIWVAMPFKPVLLLLNKINNKTESNSNKKEQKEIAKELDDEKKQLLQEAQEIKKKLKRSRSCKNNVAVATLSVFFISGVMHEYLVLCGSGVQVYLDEFIGQECLFFTLHGMVVLLERLVQPYLKVQQGFVAEILKRIWVIWFAFRTFHLFLNGFAQWELWNANPFNAFTPYFVEHLWRKYPILEPFCGSYL